VEKPLLTAQKKQKSPGQILKKWYNYSGRKENHYKEIKMVKKATGAKAVKVETEVNNDIEGGQKERKYNARIIFSDKTFTIDIPICWNKLSSKEIDKEYPIIYRSPKGDEVRNKT
jgi:hypothetical protein